ncbi:RNA polymerase sigma factor [Paenibacillus sp. MWE-103]|uniref:RNA polymerase sigma factor n=1 Tax=Paenibacillus artemisiicola TaxID=1172618 RepID=A0ABS3W347_9BACL|nr:RNA polymerase sigma factor [Paenibacillus artemisiicola]
MEDDYLRHVTRLNPPEIDALVRHYWHDVWQYAYFLVRNEHLAEDIAQETFIRAFRAIEAFRGQCPVKSWLFKIARNTAFNFRKSAFLCRVVLAGQPPDTRRAPSAEAEYWDGRRTDDVWAAVLDLPRAHREMLILHAHYGLTYADLAEVLGVGEGTVKSRLHRARAKLAKRMKEAIAHDDGT